MASRRQVCVSLAVADVVLFLLASAFNDHSSTSVDGILWWLALFAFALLIAAGVVVLVQYVWSKRRRRKRAPAR
jgi:ABC-type nickel/cobalt efflux system permease component RcnA